MFFSLHALLEAKIEGLEFRPDLLVVGVGLQLVLQGKDPVVEGLLGLLQEGVGGLARLAVAHEAGEVDDAHRGAALGGALLAGAETEGKGQKQGENEALVHGA